MTAGSPAGLNALKTRAWKFIYTSKSKWNRFDVTPRRKWVFFLLSVWFSFYSWVGGFWSWDPYG
jgi:hypothetical protein